MQKTIKQLEEIISGYGEKLAALSAEQFMYRYAPGKWSRKEELGHLIDSAYTNLRRFVVAQYEQEPKITYRQEEWVRMAGYEQQPAEPLIQLWMLVNGQIVHVLKQMPAAARERFCDTGSGKQELHTLNWLAEDYVKHMLHHLHHILDLEPVAY